MYNDAINYITQLITNILLKFLKLDIYFNPVENLEFIVVSHPKHNNSAINDVVD